MRQFVRSLVMVLIVCMGSGLWAQQPDTASTRRFADCLCRCSSGWAAHIGVFYDPDHQRAATCESMGPCIGGIGASGCSSRHFLTANAECSRACWDQAFPGQAFNPTTTQEFSDTLNQRYRQRRGVSPSK